MCTATLTLPAFEISVRGRRAPLPRRQLIGIHTETHRTAGLPPFRSSGSEDLAEAFGFGLRTDPHRPGHDKHPHTIGDRASAQNVGDNTQILDASIRARAHEHSVD